MAKEFYTNIDLKGQLLINGSAGVVGRALISNGPNNPPSWGGDVFLDGGSAITVFTPNAYTLIDGGGANG